MLFAKFISQTILTSKTSCLGIRGWAWLASLCVSIGCMYVHMYILCVCACVCMYCIVWYCNSILGVCLLWCGVVYCIVLYCNTRGSCVYLWVCVCMFGCACARVNIWVFERLPRFLHLIPLTPRPSVIYRISAPTAHVHFGIRSRYK